MYFIYNRIRKYLLIIAVVGLLVMPVKVMGATATTFKDTLTESRPSTVANHTIVWDVVDATGIQAGDSFIITLASGFTDSSITEDDVDVTDDSTDITTAADCSGSEKMSVENSSHVLTFTGCAGDGLNIAASSVVTIKIGTNATENGTGSNQITNPSAGSYTISMAGTGYTDSAELQVAVIAGVTTSLAVSASLSVTIAAVDASQSINGATTGITTTATTIPFGTMTVNADKIGAQTVTVSTNAAEGYTTSIHWFGTGTNDGLTSGSNNIDGFTNATATNGDPKAWVAGTNPSGTGANVNTGWYGYTTEDATLGTGTVDRFTSSGGDKWAPFSLTPYEVAYTDAPVNAEATKIGYKVEVNALQPQGSYSGTTEYITTPIF